MHRAAAVSLLFALLVVLSGCLASAPGASSRTPVDCNDSVRSTVDPADNIEPRPLPTGPPTMNNTTAKQYVVDFERAYAHNGALTEETTNVSVRVGNVSVTMVGTAYEVRLCSKTVTTSGGATATQVGEQVLVTYNVTSSTLVRADGTDPSWPSTSAGIVVECY